MALANHPSPTTRPDVSIVVPMHNEMENLPGTIERIANSIGETTASFEIVAVDDGSTDTTASRLHDMARTMRWLRVVSYPKNRGRGYALRRGFVEATGHIIATIDADLSYAPEYVGQMVAILADRPDVDFVVGSPYTKGGGTLGVPRGRLFTSRWGNRVLGLAMPGGLTAVTGILRAYRREVLQVLDLESNGKEIHLEIISKALAAGFIPAEMPAVLTGRQHGKSKFALRATTVSHLLFSFYEKPVMLFGVVGALILGLGLGAGAHLIYLWQTGTLNPSRPLVSLTVILLVAGLQVLLFGFLGSQVVQVRRELYRTQRTIKSLAHSLFEAASTGETTPSPTRPEVEQPRPTSDVTT